MTVLKFPTTLTVIYSENSQDTKEDKAREVQRH